MKMKGTRQIVGSVIICLLGVFFIARLVQQRRAGNCVLQARVAVVGRDAPIARALHSSSDVLSLRNAGGADWTDVEVTISGFETTATRGTQPTGAYRRTKNVVPAGKSTSFNVNDFEKAGGQHWVSLTMRVDLVSLKARVSGKACAAEMNPNGAALEVPER